jgi:hypothetical protein
VRSSEGIRPGADVENVDIAELRGVCRFRRANRAAERIGRGGFRLKHKTRNAQRIRAAGTAENFV